MPPIALLTPDFVGADAAWSACAAPVLPPPTFTPGPPQPISPSPATAAIVIIRFEFISVLPVVCVSASRRTQGKRAASGNRE